MQAILLLQQIKFANQFISNILLQCLYVFNAYDSVFPIGSMLMMNEYNQALWYVYITYYFFLYMNEILPTFFIANYSRL